MGSSACGDHQQFLERLRKSDEVRWLVARWLTGLGYAVEIEPVREAPTQGEWRNFVDNGDLRVMMRVEVKQRGLSFTSREDWPYSDGFIVCSKGSFDRAQPKPFAYIYLNREGTHAGFVKSATHRQWWVETRKDHGYESVYQEYYFAPLECVTFGALLRKGGNCAGDER